MERILTLNIGATRLALAEFEVRPGKGPNLLRYAFGEVPEGLTETPDSLAVGLEQALRAEGFRESEIEAIFYKNALRFFCGNL